MSKRILDAGQCGFDGPRMTRMLESKVGVDVVPADSVDHALGLLKNGGFDLVLVNRLFASSAESGIELIRQLKATGDKTPVMLVSDLPEAQAEAEAAGAVRGFGKSELGTPATVQLIKDAVG